MISHLLLRERRVEVPKKFKFGTQTYGLCGQRACSPVAKFSLTSPIKKWRSGRRIREKTELSIFIAIY
jgi:hypothetical protein